MTLTQEMILTFILEHGGKVKNSELVSKFKGLINSSDPAEKKQNRDLFKRLVNNVAVVIKVDDVKYVAVKKKYQGFITGENNSHINSLYELKSPCSSKPSRDSSEIENVDIINNNHCSTQTMSNSSKSGNNDLGCPESPESITARVLSVTSDAKSGKTGSVFALVAIKSPPNPQYEEKGKTNLKTLSSDTEPPPPVTSGRTMKPRATAYQSSVGGEGFLYRSLRVKRKELEVQASPQLRRCSKVTKPGGSEAKDSDMIPLGAIEHDWLVKSATGRWRQIYSLLLQDPQLAEKRNFMSGFTILHWAAKSGNGEMVCKVIEVSRQNSAGIDVNAKSYDGYTPLHIAAIHSHEQVLSVLVCEYGASTNIRDNSGKKAYYYLSQGVSVKIRKMLGDPHSLRKDAGCYLKDEQNLHKGFNTLSKLFQPHVAGHKKTHRRRMSFHFIRDEQKEQRT